MRQDSRLLRIFASFTIGFFIVNLLSITPALAGKGDTRKMRNHINRLKSEKSPYLLQHAGNPVDWYPWGPEAFEKALKENKPIFLSIGYSTCHWCHVMAHESFEDPEVAKLMNETFVSIKVDREERPDIDSVYMTVCQMMTGGGGWPLTVIMTPDKRPFLAGTYFPKESRFGRIGMLDLIPRIRDMWQKDRGKLLAAAEQVTVSLLKEPSPTAAHAPDKTMLGTTFEELRGHFDTQNGGFGGAPKFPTPHRLLFLLRYWKRTGDDRALAMTEKTLRAMRRGGMYDHIGYGFHRYSVDAEWLVPHFEKMLYDQALLAMAYTEGYQASGKKEYASTAREVLDYVSREMTAASGGFYSAEDADSEGVEGKFYLWGEAEVKKILGPDDSPLAIRIFSIGEGGNFTDQSTGEKPGANILHFAKPLKEGDSENKLSEEDLRKRVAAIREKLFAAREKRVRPHKDDKILTDWNGLMIAAFAAASRALDEPIYAEKAKNAADFVLTKMVDGKKRLLHRYRDGQAAVPAMLDDYAFLINGLIEIYETTFEVTYLEKALELNDALIAHFWDEKRGGFYFTADDAETPLTRRKEVYDSAIPSGNSVQMLNLLKLGRMTLNHSLEEKAAKTAAAFAADAESSPSSHTQFMTALDFATGPFYVVVVAGSATGEDTKKMLKALAKPFDPNLLVLFRPTGEESPAITRLAPFTKLQKSMDGKATAYVCENYNCKYPTTDLAEMIKQLGLKKDSTVSQ